MRSFEPSSSVTVPPPDQLPAMPANGPDWAWPVEAAREVTKKATAANVSRRVVAKNFDVGLVLLAGGFSPAPGQHPPRRRPSLSPPPGCTWFTRPHLHHLSQL